MPFRATALLTVAVASSALAGSVQIPEATFDGCLTLEKQTEYLDAVAAAYPDVATRVDVGTSFEGRPLQALCLGMACIDVDANVPEAFINGMHHSRECIAMMGIVHAIQRILEGLDESEPWALHMIKARKTIFWPIVNPDGYAWNEEHKPSGGGMQRKNRRPSCRFQPSQNGVDLNRNYPLCFDHQDGGASSMRCAEDYKGEAPFSEPETQAVRDLVKASNFTVAVNMHSYGRMMLIPYSCETEVMHKDDETYFFRYATELTEANHFVVGRSHDKVIKLYGVNGDAADWMFNEHRIFAVSPEVGGEDFWLNQGNLDQALRFATENIPMLLHSIWSAGPLIRLESYDVLQTQENLLSIRLSVLNAGLWHSRGDVFAVAQIGRDFSSHALVGPLASMYGTSEDAIITFDVATERVEAVQLYIFDQVTCIMYTLDNTSLGSVTLRHDVYATRYSTNDPNCFGSAAYPPQDKSEPTQGPTHEPSTVPAENNSPTTQSPEARTPAPTAQTMGETTQAPTFIVTQIQSMHEDEQPPIGYQNQSLAFVVTVLLLGLCCVSCLALRRGRLERDEELHDIELEPLSRT